MVNTKCRSIQQVVSNSSNSRVVVLVLPVIFAVVICNKTTSRLAADLNGSVNKMFVYLYGYVRLGIPSVQTSQQQNGPYILMNSYPFSSRRCEITEGSNASHSSSTYLEI